MNSVEVAHEAVLVNQVWELMLQQPAAGQEKVVLLLWPPGDGACQGAGA